MSDYSAEQIAALRRAIATGVLTVEHNGTRTTYRSLDEMERILEAMVVNVSGGGGRVRRTRAVYRSGA